MLYEFQQIIDPKQLPSRLSELDWHISGFVDGDGSFPIILSPVSDRKFGWLIQPRFQIELRKNADCLRTLKVILRAMQLNSRILEGPDFYKVVVTNRRLLLEKVVPFFERYRLVLKYDEVVRMKNVLVSLDTKEHLEQNGFKKIIREVFSLPTDGEDRRKWNFKQIIPDEEPPLAKYPSEYSFPDKGKDMRNYLCGFIDAEGALGYAVLSESKTLTPYFTLTHQTNAILLKAQQMLQCGHISTGRLQAYGVKIIAQKIIPFLEQYKLIAKQTSYSKFKEILELIMSAEHKTRFEYVMKLVRSQNDRGILRDHALGTYSQNSVESEDMVQHPEDVA